MARSTTSQPSTRENMPVTCSRERAGRSAVSIVVRPRLSYDALATRRTSSSLNSGKAARSWRSTTARRIPNGQYPSAPSRSPIFAARRMPNPSSAATAPRSA